MRWKRFGSKPKKLYSEKKYLKNMIGDININSETYKRKVLAKINSSKLNPIMKKRYLDTASSIKSDSFIWKKKWDKGKIFKK